MTIFRATTLTILLAGFGCAQSLGGPPLEDGETDDRLSEQSWQIHVTEAIDLKEISAKADIEVILGDVRAPEAAEEGDEPAEEPVEPDPTEEGATPEPSDGEPAEEEAAADDGEGEGDAAEKLTVVGPAYVLDIPAEGEMKVKIGRQFGFGWFTDDIEFVLVRQSGDEWVPVVFDSPEGEGDVELDDDVLSFDRLDFDAESGELTFNTADWSYSSDDSGLAEAGRLAIFAVPARAPGDLVDTYPIKVEAWCGKWDEIRGDRIVSAKRPCDTDAFNRPPVELPEVDEEPNPSESIDCGRHGSEDRGSCDCDSGYAGDLCQYSDASTCNGAGEAQDDGSCECSRSSQRRGESCEDWDCSKLSCNDSDPCTEDTCTADDGCEQRRSYSGACSSSGNDRSSGSDDSNSRSSEPAPQGGCAAGGTSGSPLALLFLVSLMAVGRMRRRG